MARWPGPSWAVVPSLEDGQALFLDACKEGIVVETFRMDHKTHFVMGRNATVVDIPTDHPSCSRQHCALVHRPDGAIMLVDLDSAHGTFLGDGTRLAANDPAVMEIGKPFKVGGSSRTYIIRKGALADEQAARPGPPRPGAGVLHKRDEREGPSNQPDAAKRSRWNETSDIAGTLPNIRALAAASSGASTFGKAVISAPLSAPKAPPTPAEAAALAAEYVRQHMGGSGMNADQKKKLLWGGKKEIAQQPVPQPEAAAGYNRWDAAEFDDGRTQDKFRKLMGVKADAVAEAPPVQAPETMNLNKQRELQGQLETQFYQGRRRQGGGTFGLGL